MTPNRNNKGDENDDFQSDRSVHYLGFRGGSVVVGIGTVLTFFWAQIRDTNARIDFNQIRLNTIEIRAERLTTDGEFRSKQIEEVRKKVEDCPKLK